MRISREKHASFLCMFHGLCIIFNFYFFTQAFFFDVVFGAGKPVKTHKLHVKPNTGVLYTKK